MRPTARLVTFPGMPFHRSTGNGEADPMIAPRVRATALLLLGLLGITVPLRAQHIPVVSPISPGTSIMSLGEALLRDGRRKEAADLLGVWLSEHPTDGRAWHYLGRIHLDDARRWHRDGHPDGIDGGMLLDFAGAAFEESQRLLADSGSVYRVLVGVERATYRVETEGWAQAITLPISPVEMPLPPVLAELGENLISSCPVGGVLVTGSLVETAAAWGRWLLDPSARRDLVLLRTDLYSWDPRYRIRMAETLGVPIDDDLPTALMRIAERRALCLSPTVDSLTVPALEWRPVRLVLAAGPPEVAGSDPELSVHQLALTGLAGSVWSEAARDVYDLAARRNRGLCRTLFRPGDLAPPIPALSSCPR